MLCPASMVIKREMRHQDPPTLCAIHSTPLSQIENMLSKFIPWANTT